MGIFTKFAASLVAIPSPVLGGMTTFLFTSVAVSGMAIIARGCVPFTRRARFILTAGLALGYGATLVPTYFDHVFTYGGENRALQGFLDAIALIMETGFAVTAFVTAVLNLTLPVELDDAVDGRDETQAEDVARSGAKDSSASEDGFKVVPGPAGVGNLSGKEGDDGQIKGGKMA
jgi:xanthine/uracil permease